MATLSSPQTNTLAYSRILSHTQWQPISEKFATNNSETEFFGIFFPFMKVRVSLYFHNSHTVNTLDRAEHTFVFASSACLLHTSAQSRLFKTIQWQYIQCSLTTLPTKTKQIWPDSVYGNMMTTRCLTWLSGCIVFICPVQLNWSNCSPAQWLIITPPNFNGLDQFLRYTDQHWDSLPPTHNELAA